jgi:hypothetical protein
VDDLVTVEVVPTGIEAALLCGILRDAGIRCFDRPTNFAVAAADVYFTPGPREIIVRAEDGDTARKLLDDRRRDAVKQ